MPCYLLIKNTPSRWRTGMVVSSHPDSHLFGRLEDKRRFIVENGGNEGWPRLYVIAKVIDVEHDDARLDLFWQRDENNLPKYRIKPQGPESKYYVELLNNAYVEVTIDQVLALVEEVPWQ